MIASEYTEVRAAAEAALDRAHETQAAVAHLKGVVWGCEDLDMMELRVVTLDLDRAAGGLRRALEAIDDHR